MSVEKAAVIAAELVTGATREAALRKAGYSKATSKHSGEILKSPNVQRALVIALETVGVTHELVGQTIKDAMLANKVELARSEGQITDERAYPDYPTRLRAAELAAEVLEGYRRKYEVAGGESKFQIVLANKYQAVFFGGPMPPEAETEAAAIDVTPAPREAATEGTEEIKL
ncbi:MAG TPA: hypothetical protein VLT62_14045 [Candidatus Methylomirabilis sp.]|nr:hypothetical protein [Candidatus Methylomirabilis sp.]